MRALLALSAVLVSSTAYAAMDIPARKAGLWQMTMNFEGGHIPQQSIKQCIDAATDKMMNSMGGQMSKENCSKQDMQRVGNTIVVDSVCKSPMGGTNVAHAVVSGDLIRQPVRSLGPSTATGVPVSSAVALSSMGNASMGNASMAHASTAHASAATP